MRKLNKIKRTFTWGGGDNPLLVDFEREEWGLVSQFFGTLDCTYISRSRMSGELEVYDFEEESLQRYLLIEESMRCDISSDLKIGAEYVPIYDYPGEQFLGFVRKGEINYGGAKLPHIEIKGDPFTLHKEFGTRHRTFKTLKWVDFTTLENKSMTFVIDTDFPLSEELCWGMYFSNICWSTVPASVLHFNSIINDPISGSLINTNFLDNNVEEIWYDKTRSLFFIVAARGYIKKVIKESDVTRPDFFFENRSQRGKDQISFLGIECIPERILPFLEEFDRVIEFFLVNTVTKCYQYSRVIAFHPETGEEYEVRIELEEGCDNYAALLKIKNEKIDEAKNGLIQKLITRYMGEIPWKCIQ